MSSSVLTNIQDHDIFFNNLGFHNHIVHHLLTIYALGADPQTLRYQFEQNAKQQRRLKPVDPKVLHDLQDHQEHKKYLGKARYYKDFLAFWQGRLEELGVAEVLKEYVFKNDDRADDLLARLFDGCSTFASELLIAQIGHSLTAERLVQGSSILSFI
jgi:hypothetical protein